MLIQVKMLKSGGVFARFANHPYKDKGREEIHEALQRIYSKYMPGSLASSEYSIDDAKKRAEIALKYGFIDISYRLYHRTKPSIYVIPGEKCGKKKSNA